MEQHKKKRLGILTFHYTTNPGSLLQAYALQKRLNSDFNVDAKIINYMDKAKLNRFKIEKYKRKYRHFSRLRLMHKEIMEYIGNYKTRNECRVFCKKYLAVNSGKVTYSDRNIASIEKHYDYFVVGSDQVWNVNNMRFSYTYLLDFVDESRKKLSYAPSFNCSNVEEVELLKIRKLLQSFSKLSARESQGCEKITELTGMHCEHILDPTLLFNDTFWEKVMVKDRIIPNQYMFVYLRSNDVEINKFAEKLSHDTGFRIVCGLNRRWNINSTNWVMDICPDKWLNLICFSECVITNSFHGVAFSIIFKKNFWVNKISGAETNWRIIDLLKNLGLENRMLDAIEETHIAMPIDYCEVYKRLAVLRKRSCAYLQSFEFYEEA